MRGGGQIEKKNNIKNLIKDLARVWNIVQVTLYLFIHTNAWLETYPLYGLFAASYQIELFFNLIKDKLFMPLRMLTQNKTIIFPWGDKNARQKRASFYRVYCLQLKLTV